MPFPWESPEAMIALGMVPPVPDEWPRVPKREARMNKARDVLLRLEPGERLEALAGYCRGCGEEDRDWKQRCQCDNDE